jgi:hypothetical protein
LKAASVLRQLDGLQAVEGPLELTNIVRPFLNWSEIATIGPNSTPEVDF